MRNWVDLFYKQKEIFLKNYDFFKKECEGDEAKEANQLIDILYSFHSNKPKAMGKSRERYVYELNELITNFEY